MDTFDMRRKKRLLITVALFLIPLAAFLAAFLITGTKEKYYYGNCYGRLPSGVPCPGKYDHDVDAGNRWIRKYTKKIREHEGNLEVTYETYLTTYVKKCICGKLCNLRK